MRTPPLATAATALATWTAVAETPCPYDTVLAVIFDQPRGEGRMPPDSPPSSTPVGDPSPKRPSPS